MTATDKRGTYRPSVKREQTKTLKKEALENAAWKVFSTIGLDAATVRDIVSISDVSPGSFYNYYKTKEVIFEILLIKIVKRVQKAAAQSRNPDDDLRLRLTRSYQAILRELLSINGAARFFELNQHHIRALLFIMKETRSLVEDFRDHLAQQISVRDFPPDRLNFIASTILTTGLEALLYISRNPLLDIDETARLVARMVTGSIYYAVTPPDKLP